MTCKDSNGTELLVSDAVMYIDCKGNEIEGMVTELLDGNKIKIDCEDGEIIIDAAMTFQLP